MSSACFTTPRIASLTHSNVSHLSDPPAMRITLLAEKLPSAAMRLWADVDLESSTKRTPFFSVTNSSRCESPDIFRRYSQVRLEQIFRAFVTIVLERIFIALWIPEKFVSLRRYFRRPEMIISSPSVRSDSASSRPNTRIFGISDGIVSPNSFAFANTCVLITEVPVV